jgi:hypothetical protein
VNLASKLNSVQEQEQEQEQGQEVLLLKGPVTKGVLLNLKGLLLKRRRRTWDSV